MNGQYTWALFEHGMQYPVAAGSARSFISARGEVTHYALQYGMDGPVTFWVKKGRKKVISGSVTPTDGEVIYKDDAP